MNDNTCHDRCKSEHQNVHKVLYKVHQKSLKDLYRPSSIREVESYSQDPKIVKLCSAPIKDWVLNYPGHRIAHVILFISKKKDDNICICYIQKFQLMLMMMNLFIIIGFF